MFNVAIIGSGNVVSAHINSLSEFPDKCKIVGLVDIYPEKAVALKEKFNLDCETFSDYKELLASDLKIDIINICTPPFTHAEMAVACMDKGINVILEKPMAPSLADCDAMIEAEKRNGVLLACIAQNRYRPDVYKLKQMIDSNIAGRVVFTEIRGAWWRARHYSDLWWRGTWEKEGGGCTLNNVVHYIDILNWMKGGLPSEVTSVLGNVSHDNSEVEDITMSILKYPDNSFAQLTGSIVHHGNQHLVSMQCEKAVMESPWNCQADKAKVNGFSVPNPEFEEVIQAQFDALEDLKYERHTAQFDDILKALEAKTQPLITSKDGRDSIEMATAMFKSGFLKTTVQLPITNDDDFYTHEGKMKHVVKFHEKGDSVENF